METWRSSLSRFLAGSVIFVLSLLFLFGTMVAARMAYGFVDMIEYGWCGDENLPRVAWLCHFDDKYGFAVLVWVAIVGGVCWLGSAIGRSFSRFERAVRERNQRY